VKATAANNDAVLLIEDWINRVQQEKLPEDF
jgi:hypothetical protein